MRLRRCALIVCGVLLVSTIVGCQQASWPEYKTAEGRFSVRMPGTPTEQVQSASTVVGPLDLHVATLEPDKDTVYMASWADYPAAAVNAANTQQILDGAAAGTVTSTKGTLISSDSIMLGTSPGRDVRVSLQGGSHIFRTRIYLVGNRLYQFIAGTTTAAATGPDVTKYLDSFTLQP